MVKRPIAINTNFASRLYPTPKQWMSFAGSELGFKICELSSDLFDPYLREPTKTVRINQILEMCDDIDLQIYSLSLGESLYTQNLLLHPDLGHRITSIGLYESLIDISAGLDIYSIGGYLGADPLNRSQFNQKGYAYAFLEDALLYLTDVAYEAGISQFHVDISGFNGDLMRIIDVVLNTAKIQITVSCFADALCGHLRSIIKSGSNKKKADDSLVSVLDQTELILYYRPGSDPNNVVEQIDEMGLSISEDIAVIYTHCLELNDAKKIEDWKKSVLHTKQLLEDL